MPNRKQFSLTVRHVFNGTVKEIFVDFVEVDRITGESLAEAILHWLHAHGYQHLTCEVSVMMVPQICLELDLGVSLSLNRRHQKSIYFHSSAHRLNLAVVSACTIRAFKNAECYLGEIHVA